MFINPFLLDYFWFPRIPANCEKPPTIYAILNSIVNFDKNPKEKIKNLAKYGREKIFDFSYPLSEKIDKEEFECMILNHYLMRRINFDTVTAFRIQLNVRLNEIMPMYNKLFDLLYDNDLFGEITKRDGTDNRTTNNSSNTQNTVSNTSSNETIADLRHSDTPQDKINNLKDGKYVTDADYNKTNSNDSSRSDGNSFNESNGTDDNVYHETISKINLFEIYNKFNEEINHIYSLIFKDLDELFYSIE